MKYQQLGQSDLKVSRICLGSMTWGQQNTEAEAHQQLDFATAQGVNFIDTAEMYPVPPKEETYTLTEQYIGSWLGKRGKRDDIVLASKIAGPSRGNDHQEYMRGGSRFTKAQIIAACEASLKRLQTDYLDIYQMHWPERKVNYFGRLGLADLEGDPKDATPLEESVEAMQTLVKAGKIRYFGLSNDTPWGVAECLRLARERGLPRVLTVQNPYSLLNRSYEIGMAEMSLRENVPLLAYSPLAFGMLTGKYRHGAKPQGARLTEFARFQRYNKPQAFAAVEKYAAIADAAGISLTTLALAFVNQRAFVGSNIIGATNLAQLEEDIASAEVTLSADTLEAIENVHAVISNPCP